VLRPLDSLSAGLFVDLFEGAPRVIVQFGYCSKWTFFPPCYPAGRLSPGPTLFFWPDACPQARRVSPGLTLVTRPEACQLARRSCSGPTHVTRPEAYHLARCSASRPMLVPRPDVCQLARRSGSGPTHVTVQDACGPTLFFWPDACYPAGRLSPGPKLVTRPDACHLAAGFACPESLHGPMVCMGLSFALFGLVMCAGQLYLGCGPLQCGRTNFLLIGPLFYIGLFCVHGPTLAGPACSCTMHHGLVHSIWVRVTIICVPVNLWELTYKVHSYRFPWSSRYRQGM
jgi:hypothetical protein